MASNAGQAGGDPLEDPLEMAPGKQKARSFGPGLTCVFVGGGGGI